MQGISGSQIGVVFYEDDTPEFHAEQEWEHKFQPVDGHVSEFDHSHLHAQGTNTWLYIKLQYTHIESNSCAE